MHKCWCGKDHDLVSQRGDTRNGPIKHFVLNWKLYDLRKDGQGEEMVADEKNPGKRRAKA